MIPFDKLDHNWKLEGKNLFSDTTEEIETVYQKFEKVIKITKRYCR